MSGPRRTPKLRSRGAAAAASPDLDDSRYAAESRCRQPVKSHRIRPFEHFNASERSLLGGTVFRRSAARRNGSAQTAPERLRRRHDDRSTRARARAFGSLATAHAAHAERAGTKESPDHRRRASGGRRRRRRPHGRDREIRADARRGRSETLWGRSSAGRRRSGGLRSWDCSSSRWRSSSRCCCGDAGGSSATSLVAAAILSVAAVLFSVESSSPTGRPVKAHLLARWGYPELRLTAATIVLVVGRTGARARGSCARGAWLDSVGAAGAVVLGAALPSAALGALALGLGAGALVRLAVRHRRRGPARPNRCARRWPRSASRCGDLRRTRGSAPGPRRTSGGTPGRRLERARARPRRAGHAAAGAALAPARLPRPTAERRGGPAGAGRARGAHDPDGRAGRRPRARGRHGGARPGRRRGGRHAPARTSTRSSSQAPNR